MGTQIIIIIYVGSIVCVEQLSSDRLKISFKKRNIFITVFKLDILLL